MNDNQYLAHGAFICHSGVKGMKWGKHLKAAQSSNKYSAAEYNANAAVQKAQADGMKRTQQIRNQQNLSKAQADGAKRTEQLRSQEHTANMANVYDAQARGAKRTWQLKKENKDAQGAYDAKMAYIWNKYDAKQARKQPFLFRRAKVIFGKPRLSKVVKTR